MYTNYTLKRFVLHYVNKYELEISKSIIFLIMIQFEQNIIKEAFT